MPGKKNFPKRGEIFWIELDPARGSETQKTRPGLIVSNDIGNETSNTVMIAPITSKVLRVYPFEVETLVDEKPAKIMLNQCRAVGKSRLKGKIANAEPNIMKAVDEAIKIVFALI